MNLKHRYSEEQLVAIVKESSSFAEVLRKLDIKAAGGNYATLKSKIREMGLDTSHFLGAGWAKGKLLDTPRATKLSLEQILSNGVAYKNTNRLRKRLIKEGYFEHRCSSCKLTDWLELPIPLEVDHINGDRFDNRLENLRLLCPNCHALTHNYRGKNKRARPSELHDGD